MKKFRLLSIMMYLCLLCCGCDTKIQNIEVLDEGVKPETINVQESDTSKMSETEIFENNLKCQDYKDEFIKRSEYVASPSEPIGITIFYSPIKNTCIGYFSTKYDSSNDGYNGDEYIYDREFFVVNAFDDSAEWSIYRYGINNVYNVTGCDWVSGFGYDAGMLKSECNSENEVEKLWWDEINYLKGN